MGELEVQRDDEFAARLAAERRVGELETLLHEWTGRRM